MGYYFFSRHCSNCGMILSEENIALAIRDYGISEDLDQISEEEADHFSFCCPSYSDENGCQGYSLEDWEAPAYWIYR